MDGLQKMKIEDKMCVGFFLLIFLLGMFVLIGTFDKGLQNFWKVSRDTVEIGLSDSVKMILVVFFWDYG